MKRTAFWRQIREDADAHLPSAVVHGAHDACNRAELEAAGRTALTVWECELKADAEGVVRCLAGELRKDD